MTADDKATAAKEQRAAERRRATAAFQALKNNRDFQVAWEWLKERFPMNRPSFLPGQESNTHLAAARDGQKDLMFAIEHMLSLPTPAEVEDGDAKARPTQAVSELGGTPTPP